MLGETCHCVINDSSVDKDQDNCARLTFVVKHVLHSSVKSKDT